MTGSSLTERARRPGPILEVAPGTEVDLWTESASPSDDLARSLALLADDERSRAERFRFERDRIRFVSRRAFARRVLAGYVGLHPGDVAIATSASGKPALVTPGDITFSASHADDLAVIAVARGRAVGVDIEREREMDDAMDLAEGLFHGQEVDLLRSVAGSARSRAFLRLWTRKEAFVKAVGDGLSIPLDGFSVAGSDAAGAGRPTGPAGPMPFAFVQLEAEDGYIGAVALAGERVTVRHMDARMVA